jgi:hypothetical protein
MLDEIRKTVIQVGMEENECGTSDFISSSTTQSGPAARDKNVGSQFWTPPATRLVKATSDDAGEVSALFYLLLPIWAGISTPPMRSKSVGPCWP